MKELDIEARVENLPQVLDFITEELDKVDCSMKARIQIEVAVEEIFVNIAHYAYKPDIGGAIIRIEVTDKPLKVTLAFIDHGVRYDPLAKEDPDVTQSAEERQIGGLGIFMVKKSMDGVHYEYKDGQNILTIEKNLE